MRFLLDKNLPAVAAEPLLAAGHDVLIVADSPHRGSSDEVLWARAARERRIIVTRDLDFPLPIEETTPSGIVLLRLPLRVDRAALVRAVKRLLVAVPAADLEGFITVVEPARIRRRPLRGGGVR